MIDQLPADPVGIEIGDDHGAGGVAAWPRRFRGTRCRAPRAAGLPVSSAAISRAHGLLAFAAHDDVDLRLLAEDLAPVIGRKDAAIDDRDVGQRRAQSRCVTSAIDRDGRRSSRNGRTSPPPDDSANASATISFVRHRPEFGVDQPRPRGHRRSAARRSTSRPSGGRCSSGIRLPIEGCGTLISRMRMMPAPSAQRLGTGSSAGTCRPPKRRSRGERTPAPPSRSSAVEFRPHPLGEMQFGIGAFPEQEVGQPLLAAGADDEVDVAQPGLAGDELREQSRGSARSMPASLAAALQDRVARRSSRPRCADAARRRPRSPLPRVRSPPRCRRAGDRAARSRSAGRRCLTRLSTSLAR